MKDKDRVLIKGLIGVGIAFIVSYAVFTPAILIAKPSIGKAFALGVPPMVIIALSWMVGAWWALDKSLSIFSAITIGMMPIRIVIYGAWLYFIHLFIPDASIMAVVLSSICHWIVFMIPEAMTFNGFVKVRGYKAKEKEKEKKKVKTDEEYRHLLPTLQQSTKRNLRYRV